jgi:hypothetical protein
VFDAPGVDTPDDEYIADWTAMLADRIQSTREPVTTRKV